ncbi:MAG: hypothetical protein MUO27_07125, partial [Sedimentisphaerales bacterium]|nr:hypothetical protein [Sedimentisphaerales bacterium]
MRVAQLLTPAIFLVILSNPAFAQLEKADMPLIAKANPALAGIKELSVVISTPDSEPNKDGLVLSDLKAEVIAKLYDAGFKVSRSPAGHIVAIPELRINLGMLKLESCGQYVISVQTSLARGVALLDSGQLHIGADVWKVESGMQAVATEKMPDEVSAIVQQQVKAFVIACSVAGSTDKQSADVPAKTSSPRKAKANQTAGSDKQSDAGAKFVASKNSQ